MGLLFGRLRLVRTFWRSGQLAWRLVRDPRTPLMPKLVLGAALLYAVSPIDLVPDVIPFLGQLDDVAVLAIALPWFFKNVPDWLISEHEAAIGRTRDGKPILSGTGVSPVAGAGQGPATAAQRALASARRWL